MWNATNIEFDIMHNFILRQQCGTPTNIEFDIMYTFILRQQCGTPQT